MAAYATYEGSAGTFSGVIRRDGTDRFDWRCLHLHRTRQAATKCGEWVLGRAARGQCWCECHRSARDLFAQCCSCAV